MPCSYCSVGFSLIKWKNRCQVCLSNFCTNCMIQKKCLPCHRVIGSQLLYETLMKLKVKDLKLYLSARDLPVSLCKEKRELVQMIQRHSNIGVSQQQDVPSHFSRNIEQNASNLSYTQPCVSNHGQTHWTRATHQQEATNASRSEDNLGSASGLGYGESGRKAAVNNDSDNSPPLEPIPRPVPSGNGNKLLISDITYVGQIDGLTSREMKQILVDNFVDYKGCVEKSELHVRVKNLYSDRAKNDKKVTQDEAGDELSGDEQTCKICWDQPIDCVLLECGHMVTCTACGKRLNECPICRQFVVRCVHVFRS